MNTSILFDAIRLTPEYKDMCAKLGEISAEGGRLPLMAGGVSGGSEIALIYSLVSDIRKAGGGTVLIVTAEERKANRLNGFMEKSGLKSALYPMRDFNFYDMTASRDVENERLGVLSGISDNSLDVVFASPDALMQYTMPKKELEKRTFKIKISDSLEIEELCRKLFDSGYSPCDKVESEGQYAVRGGIVDLFSTSGNFTLNQKKIPGGAPVRIEFFGDEIERMELFDPLTQRMTGKIDSFEITPSKEITASEDDREKIREIISALKSSATSESSVNELERELFSLQHRTSDAFLDRFISLIYPQRECLLDYFGGNSYSVLCDGGAVEKKADNARKISEESAKTLIENGLIPPEYADYSAHVSHFEKFLAGRRIININPFLAGTNGHIGGIYNFKTKNSPQSSPSLNTACEELGNLCKKGYTCVLVCRTESEQKGAIKTLNELCIPAFNATGLDFGKLKKGAVGVICDVFNEGYEITDSLFALIALPSNMAQDAPIGRKRKVLTKNAGEKIFSCADLNVGDYVVHAGYGIGKYLGIENLCVCGAHRDYIAIQYAGTDKLYLPVEQLDFVAKYIGAGSLEGNVRLSKMGGSEWKKSKERAKSAAKDMAKELIELYARRTRINGFAFRPDGLMEREFDSSFEFEETDSQREAIAEIKADMERPYPMDRVLCGDVGYGKTEVAFRAAMKAVANGKQAAMLVPTTILAMQHYQTAISRFAGTGVNIEVISRFKNAAEQSSVLRRLRRGDVDIIIGTHKLLNGKIEFKDLGLLIVDEEQRFGVAQKEKIKKAAPDVDVLTLSATPIPRTLSMAMSGIRDMSLLEDAPTGRMAVSSYVLEYNENIINDAIGRELHRGGQVFYLYNDTEYIYRAASKLKNTFPDASVAVAHGQMDSRDIENIWRELVAGKIDILVSTTIVETGIDIPNANTLIIENADKMGLAQLHQIRGRVGRSHRRAYAYFTYRKGKEISEIARRRLEAIRDFTEFGAGFKIAMRDLEIRGAGNLLGASQHGHLDSVGYDMYVRLLNEAVLEEKGKEVQKSFETQLILSSDAYLPKSYIKTSVQRMEMYKKIAHIQNRDDYKDLISELSDRFGKPPAPAKTLAEGALVKAYAKTAGIKKVEQQKDEVRLFPEEPKPRVLAEISSFGKGTVSVRAAGAPYIAVKTDGGSAFAECTVRVLEYYIKKCNECD